MTESLAQVMEKALELSPQDRARLSSVMIQSLESQPESGTDDAWEVEIRNRLQGMDHGVVTPVPRDLAMKLIREG